MDNLEIDGLKWHVSSRKSAARCDGEADERRHRGQSCIVNHTELSGKDPPKYIRTVLTYRSVRRECPVLAPSAVRVSK